MNIVFRQPTPGDIGWVISMHGKIYSQDFQLGPQFEIDIARKLVLFFDKANDFDLFLIPIIKGCRAGSIAVSKESKKIAFVNFVLVVPELRGQGIATNMMYKVINYAQQHDCKTLRLETYSVYTMLESFIKSLAFIWSKVIKTLKSMVNVLIKNFGS